MKNKWLLLAMVFVLGLIGSPVFAFGPSGDGVFIGKAPETPTASATILPSAVQLETVMGTLLATLLMSAIYFGTVKLIEGPATNAPERYDKVRSASSVAQLKTTRQNTGRFRRQAS